MDPGVANQILHQTLRSPRYYRKAGDGFLYHLMVSPGTPSHESAGLYGSRGISLCLRTSRSLQRKQLFELYWPLKNGRTPSPLVSTQTNQACDFLINISTDPVKTRRLITRRSTVTPTLLGFQHHERRVWRGSSQTVIRWNWIADQKSKQQSLHHAWVKPLQSEKLSSTLLRKTTLQSVSDQIPKCLSKQSPLSGIRQNSTEFSPTSTRFISLHLLPLIVVVSFSPQEPIMGQQMGLQKPVSHPILLWAKLILIFCMFY